MYLMKRKLILKSKVGEKMKWYMKFIWTLLIIAMVILVYYSGVFLWQTLEICLDGEVHISNADTVVNIVLTYLITKNTVIKCLKLVYK